MMPSRGSSRTRRLAKKRGSPGAGLRGSSVRGARRQSAATEYCQIRERQLLQCRHCRHQTSLIAGAILQGTKLPMRVWFRAMRLVAQGKKGLSNIELGRRLGISTNAAWRVQHKLMQADAGHEIG